MSHDAPTDLYSVHRPGEIVPMGNTISLTLVFLQGKRDSFEVSENATVAWLKYLIESKLGYAVQIPIASSRTDDDIGAPLRSNV